ncbi:hypothetical protein [Streptomyces sp. NPDC051776]|uniref:hypothetical protein n=1 Tax=Streptomyces sp. NPDC051776 TaxID=3155414 RepID=UPI0034325BEA
MDLDALRHANFKLLDEAVTDWSTLVNNLEKLEKSAREGLKGAANKANWTGVNATVSKEFIGKTAGEFDDAHTQATTIRNILRDTRDELKNYHTKLTEAIGRAQNDHIEVISGSNRGFTVRGAKSSDVSDSKVTAVRDEIQKILSDATESDTSANAVLQAIANQSRLGFSDANYKDRDAAAAAAKEADELSKLAKKDPEDLSTAEFDRLNAGLKKYANDDLFAERFASKLGAKGTLDFWANINQSQVNPELGRERHDQFDDLQKNLSLTLANATQSNSAAMTDWTRQVVDLGDKPVGRSGGLLGVQVMSNLMRWGDYSDGFLKEYGHKLMETEKKFTDNGRHGAWRRVGSDFNHNLNRTGSDSGWDPMTGYLKGLSNSPDAATEFFNDTFVSKNEDHDFTHDTDNDGKEGRRTLSNFDYLFEERDWPPEMNNEGDESNTGRNNLALALEAATTGHPAGEMPTADTPAHNAQQAKLFEDIVKSVSEDPKRLTDHRFMSDSLGQISAEYMPDIHRGLHPGEEYEDKLFPVAGSAAKLGENDITRFLYSVGQDPDGYAAVNLGQHSYTTSLMEYHFRHPDAYVVDPASTNSENLKKAIEDIARVAGEVEGTIAAGRAYEGELEGGAKDEDYNSVLEHASTWGGTAVGIGIGLGTAPFVGPGGIVAGGVAGTAADEIIGAITDGLTKDSSDEVIYRNGQEMDGTKESTYILVENASKKAAESAENPHPLIVAATATAAEQGFNNAKTNVSDAFDGQGVPRQLEKEG